MEVKLYIGNLEGPLVGLLMSEIVLSHEQGGRPLGIGTLIRAGEQVWARIAEPLPEPPTGSPTPSEQGDQGETEETEWRPASQSPSPTSPMPSPKSRRVPKSTEERFHSRDYGPASDPRTM